MNKYIPLLCIPLLPFLGCSTTSDMARYKADNGASRRLEKRIDDLSGTISLLVNDGNRLHSDLVEVKTLAKEVQQKTDGLATSIRDLEERLDGVVASLKEKVAAAPPQPESNATPDQTPFTEFNKLLEKVISDVRQVAGSEKKDVAVGEQTKPSPAESTPAVETQSAGADKGEDVQKEAVRLLVENAPKEPEERKMVESLPIQSVPPARQMLPEENKVVEIVPAVKQELAATSTAKEQESAKVPEVVAKIEEKVAVAPSVVALATEVKQAAEATQKAPEDQKKPVEAPPVQSVQPVRQALPEEKKTVEVLIVEQDLVAANAANVQKAAIAPEVVAKIDEKITVVPPAVAPAIEGKPAAEAAPKALEEQKPVVASPVQSVQPVRQVQREEKKGESSQTGSETTKQTSEPKAESSVANLLSEPRAREPYLKEAIGRLAEKVFPDNKGIRWNVISFDHKAHLTHTEAEPLQADLGYPRFKFVVSFKTPENPVIIGTYSFSNSQYAPYFPKKK